MAQTKDEEQESQRILRGIEEEVQGSGMFDRTAKRVENHLSAKDADPHDRVEIWGTRIGRSIGAFVLVALILYMLNYLIT